MGDATTKSKIMISLFWKSIETTGVQGIQFIVMIILARLVEPEDFGLITIVIIFILLANVIVQSGFTAALIQNKKVDDVDFSSVFYLNVFLATILYIIFFYTAPFISTFFEQPQLVNVLRTLSFILFFNALNSIQNAIISRNMQFKKLFNSSISAVILSGIVGITMAYSNFGVWALVGQQLTYQFVFTAILFSIISWRPKLLFSINRLKNLFSFGWKILVAGFIDVLEKNIRGLLIGKFFSPAMLGFYNRGEQFPSLIVNNINGAIQSVMFPALASHQEDKQRIKVMVKRSIKTSSFIIFPLMVGLAVIAEPLVKVLLTEKWLPAVPFLQIFCASYAFWPIHTTNLQAINALGRSDIFLKLEILKKLAGLLILLISIQFGVYGMAIGVFVGSLLGTFINSYPNLTLFNYGIFEQWKDISPALVLSLVMGGIIYTIQWLNMPDMIALIIQVVAGVVLYIGLAIMFKLDSFVYILSTCKDFIRNKKSKKLLISKKAA